MKITIKRILTTAAVYLGCIGLIAGGIYASVAVFGQKTLYLEKKQWHPAEPETQHIDPARLNKALDYIATRLPTARSLLLLRNGKTVVEKYYWHGGPQEVDYLHSLNAPLLQVLIGIAIDLELIQGPAQPLSVFFPTHLKKIRSDGAAPLTLDHLLRAQAPLLWGVGHPDYWSLFYAQNRVAECLHVVARHQVESQPAIRLAAAYLLSQVIERVSGQSVFDFANRYLFKSLGITTYGADKDKRPLDPMVGFMLKALDLVKIGYLLAREGAWEGQQIVSEQWIRKVFQDAPVAGLAVPLGGNWVKTVIQGHESLVARGDGGQYLVLVPSLHLVVVTTSTSRFTLPQDNGHDRLLQLILEAVMDTSDVDGRKAGTAPVTESEKGESTDRLAPNYVFSTPVPQDILDFFDGFAQDIISKDTKRIAENYARAYDHSRDVFASPFSLLLAGSAPHLEYVHITKIRIEKNRGYLRGRLKFAHRTYAGPQGVYPLENLIKLKGRWRWLGLPDKTALLDRDDYFDAELSEAQQQFVKDCSGSLIGETTFFEDDCIAEIFHLPGGGRERFVKRIQPFLQGRSDVRIHITRIIPNGAAYRVRGYIEGTALGDLYLPDNLHIIQENGAWKWTAVDSV
jgi:hypothetical protein